MTERKQLPGETITDDETLYSKSLKSSSLFATLNFIALANNAWK